MITADALEARLRDFLGKELRVSGPIEPDAALVTTGRIDSVGLVRLAAFVERTAGVRIPDRDVTAANFDTLSAIRTYLAARVGG